MSNTTVWTVDNTIYEYAKQTMKSRVSSQWEKWLADPNSINLWQTYNSVLNTNWDDPWYESELWGIYNGPSRGGSDPAYEMTQNMYSIYNWLKYKGYNRYAMIAFIMCGIWETTLTGGIWEDRISPYPAYASNHNGLIGFNAASLAQSSNNYTWYNPSGIIPAWTASFTDESTGVDYELTADAGSWDAVRKFYIATYEDEFGHRHPIIPLRFDRDSDNPSAYYHYDYVGYGLVQWTPWNVLVRHAGLWYPNYGNKHWQLNLTAQLMVLEWERIDAMDKSPNDQWAGEGHPYYGEWVDSNATRAFFNYQGGKYHYNGSCTWDNWANDGFVSWVQTRCSQLGITSEGTIERCTREIAITIFEYCYLHAHHTSDSIKTVWNKTSYIAGAIDYWDSNGGFNPLDIPRPRDLPHTELDDLHIQEYNKMIMFIQTPTTRKKVKKRVSAILL